MKNLCNRCSQELQISPADYTVKHMICLNKKCSSYGLLVAYPKSVQGSKDDSC